MTKLISVSDSHCQLSQVKVPGDENDIFIHAGDWSYFAHQHEIRKFGRDLRKLPHKYKIIVPGNHDLTFDPLHSKFHFDRIKWLTGSLNGILEDQNIYLLINNSITLDGITFYGTPMINRIGDWAFGYSDGLKKEIYDKVDYKIDVLISHSPPFGIMDEENYGCKELLKFTQRIKPKVHIFGHCHEGYGQQQIGETLFINTSTCNRSYLPRNKPIITEI